MKRTNMPAFTAEASLYKTNGRYRASAAQSYIGGGQGVISQARRLPGQMGGFRPRGGSLQEQGFWCEAACTVTCSLLAGPEAILECLELCEMACD